MRLVNLLKAKQLLWRAIIVRRFSAVLMMLMVSACTHNYVQHNIGLMAPEFHGDVEPVQVCQFSVRVSDPTFTATSHQLFDQALRDQLLKYIQYDGRIKILNPDQKNANYNHTKSATENCLWQQLTIEFTGLSDQVTMSLGLIDSYSLVIETAANINLSANTSDASSRNRHFSHRESMPLTVGDSWQADRLLTINSVRNRTNFIEAVIARIVSESRL